MAIDPAAIGRLVEDIGGELVEWRRRLHQNPELSFEEVETSRFVYETLESFGAGLELSRPTETSVLARLVGENPGRTIAIRADMDALPVQEETGVPFASENEGVAHACGHDGHIAILLGTAKVLGELREHVNGEVRFVFQHAEELPYGGAEELVEAGVVDGADAVISLHLAASLEAGKVGISSGAVLAAPDRFEIVVEGAGGHAGWPHLTVDPMAVAAQVVTNLQHVVSRNTDARDAAIVSVTKIVGGTAFNVIPDKAEMEGTMRAFDEEVREKVPELMERVVKGVADAHGASFSFEYYRGPDPVVNDEGVARVVEETARELFGEEAVEAPAPTMGGEDFSAYQRVAPTAFFLVGTQNEEKGITHPNHHPSFDIDEDTLPIGVKMFVHATMKLLGAESRTRTEAKGG